VRGVVAALLVNGEVHVCNLVVVREVGNVAGQWTGAGGAIVRSVKPTGETIPPIVVFLDRMGRVVALPKE
jgi:hypothetical protein